MSERLAADLGARLGGAVTDLRRLSGGASRETWAFVLDDQRRLILRRDPPIAPKSGMVREAELLRAAAAAGVPVPELVDASDDPEVLGSAYLVMVHVDGETIPRKILRDAEYADARPKLARQCGEILARLHTIDPDAVEGLEEVDQVTQYRAVLNSVGQPHPTFELAFRWLEEHRPDGNRRTVVHGDFRNGNVIVGPEGVRAVLDWELAHTGDPMEDLGWLCVKSWRFGVDLPVGGFGTYEDLAAGYGDDVDLEALRWWEILGTLKWGIMCIMQTVAHTSGMRRSVELAAIGRRVCEVEWDLLEVLS
ncbi:MAG TPA: phosphotransferase family protein [Acidimicrobiales bacterium]|nr:phosphotransferase family protein [Acidimicrobiales bacterium]